MIKKISAYLFCYFYTLSFFAAADTGQYPNIGMDYDATLQYDFSHARQDTTHISSDTTDGYPDINSTIYFRFTHNDEIRLSTEIYPINSPNNGEHRWFDDVGLIINDLNFYHQNEQSAYTVGKVPVIFGRAMDVSPGLYTSDFVSVYNLDGMLGGSYNYRYYNQAIGVIESNVNLYTEDTSNLSRPFFRPGQKTNRSDGGPANNGQLNSYAITINSLAIPSLPYLELQAGFMKNQSPSEPATVPASSEYVHVASARYIVPFTSTTTLGETLNGNYMDVVPFIEYADVSNEDSITGNDTSYLTTSLTFDFGQWSFGATRTNKTYSLSNTPDDYLNELSVSYDITGQLVLVVSAGTEKSAGDISNIAGLTITYSGAQ